jgi:endoglucanase
MSPASKTFLLDLLSTPSPTGFEHRGQRKWAAQVRHFADRVESDAYGTAWATLDGSGAGRRLMFEAHADEIGYMVKFISKDGFIFVDRVGGSDVATARGRRVEIFGDKGSVRGVIGNIAIHIRDREDEKVPKVHELAIDIGASSAKEVAKAGIRVGHPAIYADGVEEIGADKLCGRALDNRVGGFIIAEVVARLSKRKSRLPTTVYAVNAVQEELGCHGARMAAHRIRPAVALVFDVTHATDTPGINASQHGLVQLGKGPSIAHGAANHPLVMQRLMEVAEKLDIPIQHEAVSRSTSTDADVIYTSRDGIPCGLISIPLRYMHSPVETISLADAKNAARLAAGFIRSLSKSETFRVLD